MQEFISLKTPKTARIYLAGNISEQVRDVWLVTHGYGQLGSYFIQHFQDMADLQTLVAAPEGLSRFYLNGFSGRVGATWMTKEARLDEITDQVAYLDNTIAYLLNQIGNTEVRLHVLGFSQGVATAWRWLMQGKHAPVSFTLWAGKAPDEWNKQIEKRLSKIPVMLICGDDDEFISADMLDQEIGRLKGYIPQLMTHKFRGKHHLDKKMLEYVKHVLIP